MKDQNPLLSYHQNRFQQFISFLQLELKVFTKIKMVLVVISSPYSAKRILLLFLRLKEVERLRT
jgi:hypothetical protein